MESPAPAGKLMLTDATLVCHHATAVSIASIPDACRCVQAVQDMRRKYSWPWGASATRGWTDLPLRGQKVVARSALQCSTPTISRPDDGQHQGSGAGGAWQGVAGRGGTSRCPRWPGAKERRLHPIVSASEPRCPGRAAAPSCSSSCDGVEGPPAGIHRMSQSGSSKRSNCPNTVLSRMYYSCRVQPPTPHGCLPGPGTFKQPALNIGSSHRLECSRPQ